MKNLKKLIHRDNTIKLLIVLSLVVFAVIFRLLPHPANFAPIAAIAIFGGAILPKKWALSLPLVAMIASDLFLGIHSLGNMGELFNNCPNK
jgi:energy-coupling factor transporter transmembrane protein EcfT